MNVRTDYFDHNASSPLLPEVHAAVVDAFAHLWANPHAQYRSAQAASVAVEAARRSVANLLSVPPATVFFTSGATESNSWVLRHGSGEGTTVLGSAVEHPSVSVHLDATIPVDSTGRVDLDALDRLLSTQRHGLVSVMGANNETGVLQPVVEVARRCRTHGVRLHCDASQMPGRVPLDALSAADFITLSGHKMGAPRGVGVLVANTELPPLLQGGPQERGLRAGTVNVPAVVGMGVAADLAVPMRPDARDAIETVCRRLGARILGDGAPRLPNTVSALFDIPGDLLVMSLDLEGLAASTGSACSSGSHKPSAVVEAMGLTGAPLRLSLGRDSDPTRLLHVLPQVVERARAAL